MNLRPRGWAKGKRIWQRLRHWQSRAPSFIQTYRAGWATPDSFNRGVAPTVLRDLLSAPELHRIVPTRRLARGLVVALRVGRLQRVADIPPIGIFTLPRRLMYSVAEIITRGESKCQLPGLAVLAGTWLSHPGAFFCQCEQKFFIGFAQFGGKQ